MRTGDADPLLLAAREVTRERVGLRREPDLSEQLLGALGGLGAAESLHPAQRSRDVLFRGQVVEEVELLEHHPDAGIATRCAGDLASREATRRCAL